MLTIAPYTDFALLQGLQISLCLSFLRLKCNSACPSLPASVETLKLVTLLAFKTSLKAALELQPQKFAGLHQYLLELSKDPTTRCAIVKQMTLGMDSVHCADTSACKKGVPDWLLEDPLVKLDPPLLNKKDKGHGAMAHPAFARALTPIDFSAWTQIVEGDVAERISRLVIPQVRFALSSRQDWNKMDGDFDDEEFFWTIQDLFDDQDFAAGIIRHWDKCMAHYLSVSASLTIDMGSSSATPSHAPLRPWLPLDPATSTSTRLHALPTRLPLPLLLSRLPPTPV
ncbi:hypothetical protein K438DRAFT_1980768 [Mycena galopus ATCC 62051]|nr:hypothetical protein K438DRAFT_1980768 [Mycena galopus ATCC 62051]